MGQKISTVPVDKSAQDASKWKLFYFMLKLIDYPRYEDLTTEYTSFN